MPVTREDLARLGIVDPQTGAPLPGAEAPDPFQQGTVDQYAEASDERAQQAEAALGAPGTPETAEFWKAKATEAEQKLASQTPSVAQALDAQKMQHQRWAAEAYSFAVSNRMDPTLAETVIRSELDKLNAQAELAAHRQAALPMVRRGAAEEVAAEFSDSRTGVKIDPTELAPLSSMEAMRQTAAALKKEREKGSRDLSYAARMASGVDRAEGAPAARGQSRVPEKLDPTNRIAYGLARGHL